MVWGMNFLLLISNPAIFSLNHLLTSLQTMFEVHIPREMRYFNLPMPHISTEENCWIMLYNRGALPYHKDDVFGLEILHKMFKTAGFQRELQKGSPRFCGWGGGLSAGGGGVGYQLLKVIVRPFPFRMACRDTRPLTSG